MAMLYETMFVGVYDRSDVHVRCLMTGRSIVVGVMFVVNVEKICHDRALEA